MRKRISYTPRKQETKRHIGSLSALLLSSSFFAVALNGSEAYAQQASGPIRIHTTGSTQPTFLSASNQNTANSREAVVQAASSNLAIPPTPGMNNPQVLPANFSEDFSVPAANNGSLSVPPSVLTSSSSGQFRTVANSTEVAAQPAPAAMDVPAIAPIAADSAPFAIGEEIVLENGTPVYDGAVIQEGYFPAPMSPGYSDAMRSQNVGYDPMSMQGCAPEDCRVFYAQAEALYWVQKEDQSLGFSVARQLSDFDYEWGGRITVGEMFDCVRGVEFVYTGPFEWNRTRLDVGTGLNSTFRTLDPFLAAPVSLDTFFNSDVHSQFLQTTLSSYEVNRRWFASDLFSTLIGLRMVDYDENFGFDSVAADGVGRGVYRNNIDNFLIGAQFGVNMYRPMTQRLSFGTWTKLGVFANFARNQTFLSNRADVLADASRTDTDLAGVFQGGLGLRYRILPSFTLTSGYEYMFVPGVATVANQQTFPLTLTSPNNIDQDDQVFFHGINAGLEFSY